MGGTLVIEMFKLVWPFVKENILEGGTLGEWLRRNWMTLAWMFTTTLMLFTVINLFGHVLSQRGVIATLRSTNHDLAQRNIALTQQVATLIDNNVELTGELETTYLLLTESQETAERYKGWLEHCGIDTNPRASGPPACPVRRVTRRVRVPVHVQPEPLSEPEPEKPRRFRDRLRDLFKSDSP